MHKEIAWATVFITMNWGKNISLLSVHRQGHF